MEIIPQCAVHAEDGTKAAICPRGLAKSRPGCFREGKPYGDPVQAQNHAFEVYHPTETRRHGGASSNLNLLSVWACSGTLLLTFERNFKAGYSCSTSRTCVCRKEL